MISIISYTVLRQGYQQVHPVLVVLVLAQKCSFIDNSTFMAAPGASVPVERRLEHMSTLRFAGVETQLEGTAESDNRSADICSLEKDGRKDHASATV